MIGFLLDCWKAFSGKLQAAIALIGGFFIGVLLTWIVMGFVYEGLRLPLIGQVIDGKVQTAVKAATADLVSASELAAAKTEAALAKQQLDRINAQAEKASTWGAKEDATTAEEKAKLETENANEKDGTLSHWTDADVERLRKWRSGQN